MVCSFVNFKDRTCIKTAFIAAYILANKNPTELSQPVFVVIRSHPVFIVWHTCCQITKLKNVTKYLQAKKSRK